MIFAELVPSEPVVKKPETTCSSYKVLIQIACSELETGKVNSKNDICFISTLSPMDDEINSNHETK